MCGLDTFHIKRLRYLQTQQMQRAAFVLVAANAGRARKGFRVEAVVLPKVKAFLPLPKITLEECG
jgi:hypothetical protein